MRLASDSKGNILVVDNDNLRIRRVDPSGMVTTLAGSGNSGMQDGTGIFCSFTAIKDIAVNVADEAFVIDSTMIRKISPAGEVSTLFPVTIPNPQGGADVSGCCLAVLADGRLTVQYPLAIMAYDVQGGASLIAGSVSGYQDGSAASAIFRGMCELGGGITTDSEGTIFLSDGQDNRIRKITFSTQPQPTPVSLDATMFAGVKINGKAGTTYAIESTATPESPSSWVEIARIALPVDYYVWVDKSSPAIPRRFYRARLIR